MIKEHTKQDKICEHRYPPILNANGESTGNYSKVCKYCGEEFKLLEKIKPIPLTRGPNPLATEYEQFMDMWGGSNIEFVISKKVNEIIEYLNETKNNP